MEKQRSDKVLWRVLLIDDLSVWAKIIMDFAHHFDCEVRLATNLESAVREVKRWEPHLIILDFHIPADRWEPNSLLSKKYNPNQKTLAFCEQVTSHPGLSKIIVAIVSVEEQEEFKILVKKAGAHYFSTKADFSSDDLKNLLMQVRSKNLTD